MLIVGTAIGLYLTWVSGPWLLAIGLLGLFIGTFYTSHTAVNMKYHGLGDLAVFLNFGILGSLGAFYVQSSAIILDTGPLGRPHVDAGHSHTACEQLARYPIR